MALVICWLFIFIGYFDLLSRFCTKFNSYQQNLFQFEGNNVVLIKAVESDTSQVTVTHSRHLRRVKSRFAQKISSNLKARIKKKGKIPESSTKIQFPLANSHPDPVCVIYPKSLKKEFSNNYHTPRLPAHYKTHDQISLAKIPGRAGNSPEPSLFFIPATLSFRRSALARLNIARPARTLFFRRRIGFHILYRRHGAFLPSAYFPLRNLCRARKERIMEFCFSRRHRRRCDKPPLVLFAGVSSEERKKEREVV